MADLSFRALMDRGTMEFLKRLSLHWWTLSKLVSEKVLDSSKLVPDCH